MNYWLVKSEPSVYSWEKFLKEKKAVWDGVRNFAARKNLRSMKKSDPVLFYHSNEGLAVVGIARVAKEAYQDPTTKEDWSAVDIVPYKTLNRPVTLAEIKSDKQLKNIYLVRQGRLSVMPLEKDEFNRIVELSEKK
ncbi:MAG: EVE domain-containing protein [Bacteroidia bacterium]|nr:EVE domain-containing protein [Bacteroidia bacterium]